MIICHCALSYIAARTCLRCLHADVYRGNIYLCAQYTDLTLVGHWLKRVQTARSVWCFNKSHPSLSRRLVGLSGLMLDRGPSSGLHGLRSRIGLGNFTDGQCFGPATQDWRALLGTAGRSLPDTQVNRNSRHGCAEFSEWWPSKVQAGTAGSHV